MRRFALIAFAILAGCYDSNEARWIVRKNVCQRRGQGWHYVTEYFMESTSGQFYCVRIDSVLVKQDSVDLP